MLNNTLATTATLKLPEAARWTFRARSALDDLKPMGEPAFLQSNGEQHHPGLLTRHGRRQ